MNASLPYTSEILHTDQHHLQVLNINLEAFAAKKFNHFFFPGQTAASRCEGLLTSWELTLSPSSRCIGDLV